MASCTEGLEKAGGSTGQDSGVSGGRRVGAEKAPQAGELIGFRTDTPI